MIELLGGLAALLGVLLIVAVVFALSYRRERDEARSDVADRSATIEILDRRVTVLRGDNEALLSTNKNLIRNLDDARRQIGRMEAEARAEKLSAPVQQREGTIAFTPKRDSKGKFLPKPKAPKPPKAAKKPKPVSCG